MTNDNKPSNMAFHMRGESMDRIETFVAASFAFAVTMLVIAVDDVPTSFAEFYQAIKLIPSFAASFAIIVWIWSNHADWCRQYGLEDGPTVVLSAVLVFLVLVYIYPLRVMMQGFFSAVSDGFFPTMMDYEARWEVRFMFSFYAIGFLLLCLNFVGLYRYALSKEKALVLSALERFDTVTNIQAWLLSAVVAAFALVLAQSLPMNWIGLAGHCYFLLFPVLWGHWLWRKRQLKALANTA